MKNTKNLAKRSHALLLALMMCLGMLGTTAFADETINDDSNTTVTEDATGIVETIGIEEPIASTELPGCQCGTTGRTCTDECVCAADSDCECCKEADEEEAATVKYVGFYSDTSGVILKDQKIDLGTKACLIDEPIPTLDKELGGDVYGYYSDEACENSIGMDEARLVDVVTTVYCKVIHPDKIEIAVFATDGYQNAAPDQVKDLMEYLGLNYRQTNSYSQDGRRVCCLVLSGSSLRRRYALPACD